MSQKLVVTLGEVTSRSLVVPANWVAELARVLSSVKQHAASCVFKCIIGGWTTSHRMHEPEKLPCIFGCGDGLDEINHYFLCSPLWQIASRAMQIEAPLDLARRLCTVSPTPESVRLLALVFSLYHFSKHRAKDLGGALPIGPCTVQRIAFEASHALVKHV